MSKQEPSATSVYHIPGNYDPGMDQTPSMPPSEPRLAWVGVLLILLCAALSAWGLFTIATYLRGVPL